MRKHEAKRLAQARLGAATPAKTELDMDRSVTVRIPQELYALLYAQAIDDGVTLSERVRFALAKSALERAAR